MAEHSRRATDHGKKKSDDSLPSTVQELTTKHDTATAAALEELRSSVAGLYVQQSQMLLQAQAQAKAMKNSPAYRCGASASYTGTEGSGINTRKLKVEFPRLCGDELQNWLYKCENFFELDGTPEEEKVKLAAYHLDDLALIWYRNQMKFRPPSTVMSWNEFVQQITERFGSKAFDDPFSELRDLKQENTVNEYLNQFDKLLSRIDFHLPENIAIIFFLSGLKEEIQYKVRMFMPKKLQDAFVLAKVQEAVVEALEQKTEFTPPLPPLILSSSRNSGTANSKPLASAYAGESGVGNGGSRKAAWVPGQTKMRSSEEFDEKRAKGLCFWCDEKYEIEHKCLQKKLFLLEVDPEEFLEKAVGETEVEGESEDNSSDFSMDSMTGIDESAGRNIMRITVFVGIQPLHAHIVSGSSHNFLDLSTAEHLGCRLESAEDVRVLRVADGNDINGIGMCKGFQWTIQGTAFTSDVYVMPLGSCDMILGAEWLGTLGSISFDFQKLEMEFVADGKKFVLRGLRDPLVKGKNEAYCPAMQLYSVNAIPGNDMSLDEVHSDVFEEPSRATSPLRP